MKKNVKVKFLGFWDGFDPKDNLFYNILKERYDVELSETPDYLIYSPIADYFQYAGYDCIRIMFTGEPFSADYNSTDYAIDFDDYTFGDRHMRYPLYLCQHQTYGPGYSRPKLSSSEADQVIALKKYFCNFIYGHQTIDGKREEIFAAISKYKKVDSIGRFMNNMPNGEVAIFTGKNATKKAYLQKYKFTISVESMQHDGFTTEKIKDALDACSVPIYFGNPSISKEFNPRAFINFNTFPSFKEGVEYLKMVDQNDQLYKQMLMEEPFADPQYPEKKYEELKQFLFHIFDQEKENAYRRNRYYIGNSYNSMNRYMSVHFRSRFLKFFYLVYNKLITLKGKRK